MELHPLERQELAAGRGVIGVDEVGRGALAGPLCVCAFYLPPDFSHLGTKIGDSKKLTKTQREDAFSEYYPRAVFHIESIEAELIDKVGVGIAHKKAMKQAIAQLVTRISQIQTVFVDYFNLESAFPNLRIIHPPKADSLFVSVALASIFAKVTRDRVMVELAREYPHYGWETNVGYGTEHHREAISVHGITGHHRRTFTRGVSVLQQ